LERRVYEHKKKLVPGFTSRYGLDSLVYYDITEDVISAISREKQIKGWLRVKKISLIESINPEWNDLSKDWYEMDDKTVSLTSEVWKSTDSSPSLRSGSE